MGVAWSSLVYVEWVAKLMRCFIVLEDMSAHGLVHVGWVFTQ